MKKTLLILTLGFFVMTTSCKKEEEVEIATPTRPVVQDLALQLEGDYTGTGQSSIFAPPTNFPVTLVRIDKVSSTEITITSPESIFQTFTIEDFVVDFRNHIVYHSTGGGPEIDFDPATKELDVSNPQASWGLTFNGTKN